VSEQLSKVIPSSGGPGNSARWDLSKSEAKLEELKSVFKGVGSRAVLILCHNNPDPDTIAGSLAFSHLIHKMYGVRSVIGYGGMVTRAENKAMIQRLRIKMTQFCKFDPSDYYGMVLIDAQPGTGNNLVDGKGYAPMVIIDHHPLRRMSLKAEYYDIRPNYGATSTIITEYFLAAGLTPTRSIANALLYGIKTDTNSLVRGGCKADFAAFNYLSPLTNPRVLNWIEKPKLSLEYFRDYEKALSRTTLHKDVAICNMGNVLSDAIIPEVADLLLRIDGVRWSMCFGRSGDLLILSMRSTSRVYRAGTIIRSLVGKRGSAGGHKEMAGGQILLKGMTQEEIDELSKRLIKKFLKMIERDSVAPVPMVQSEERKRVAEPAA
jgi:nanoRNase/pAp phosphatase (c-di-AMP/oligoRNAs hydrolase)